MDNNNSNQDFGLSEKAHSSAIVADQSTINKTSTPEKDFEADKNEFGPKDSPVKASTARIFSKALKNQCWNKAEKVPGRDAERWRKDGVGNIVCYKLTGCDGCLCHEYDHIVPFSQGGLTVLENCQILQTRVNRFKGNQPNNLQQLKGYSCNYNYTEKEMDLIELCLYGDVKRLDKHCRCPSIMEQWKGFKKPSKVPPCPPFN